MAIYKKKKLVSIIIRNKNESRWLKILFNEIFKQTYKNFEIVLCDNCSSDNSLQIAKKYKIKKIIKIKKYLPGYAINQGIKKSAGEYIAILSSHCIPSNNKWLENYVKYMEKNKSIVATYGKQIPLPGTNSKNFVDLNTLFRKEEIIHESDPYISNANAIYRSSILKKNLFDNKLTNIEDRIWARKIYKKGFKISYIPNSGVFHLHGIHQHNATSSRSITTSKLFEKEIKTIWRKCKFIKPENLSFILIINARREKKLLTIRKKIQKILSSELFRKLRIKRIIFISNSKLKKIKLNKKIKVLKASNTLENDLIKIYNSNKKILLDINYAITINLLGSLNINRLSKLVKSGTWVSSQSMTFAEKFSGSFIINFPDTNQLKSLSFGSRSTQPNIDLMRWKEGCIFDVDLLRTGSYVNSNPDLLYL